MSNVVPHQAPAAKEPINAGGAIAALVPQNIEQAFRLADALAKAGDMVPKAFQGKPMEIMAAVMRGLEIGLAPMQALSSIAVINGRATLWGDALPALMQRAGHHLDVEIIGEGDAMRAVARLTRGDTGKTIERSFSVADAKRAGLAGKQGPWQQYLPRMLSARARTYACRDGAADALMGLALPDDATEYGPDQARDITPAPAAPRRGGVAFREIEPEPTPGPEVDRIEEAAAEVFDPTPEDIARAEAEAQAAIARQRQEAGHG